MQSTLEERASSKGLDQEALAAQKRPRRDPDHSLSPLFRRSRFVPLFCLYRFLPASPASSDHI